MLNSVAVVGATGTIGRATCKALCASEIPTVALVRSEQAVQALPEGVETRFYEGIFNADSLRGALSGVDAVINLASRIPSPKTMLEPDAWVETKRIREQGSAILVSVMCELGIQRLVQESNTWGYADGGHHWLSERDIFSWPSLRSSDAGAEINAERIANSVVLRFGRVYSDDDPLSAAMVSMLARGVNPFPGAVDGYLSFVHVNNAANACVAALELPTGTYNVVDDAPVTRAQILELGGAEQGYHDTPSPFAAYAFSHRISNRKLKQAGDWNAGDYSFINFTREHLQ